LLLSGSDRFRAPRRRAAKGAAQPAARGTGYAGGNGSGGHRRTDETRRVYNGDRRATPAAAALTPGTWAGVAVENRLTLAAMASETPIRRTILITGCSSGIGHHSAHALAARGWHVLATCRKPQDCARLIGEGLDSFPLDYQDTASIGAGFETAMQRSGGRIDVLFNNGAFAQPGAVEDLPTDALRAIFEANFFGWHDLTRRVIPVMRAAGGGRIVQNSSVLGLAALRMRGAYVSTKFAVEGYTDTLRLELRGTGIRPILIEPGPIRTRIRENAQGHYTRWIDRDASPWSAFYRDTLEPRLFSDDPKPDPGELSCAATTAKLIHAVESPRPRARYYVTTPTYAAGFLRRVLPTRWLDAVMGRQ
jgi:NAD(P)-dependent dehydrogenase (short-subunit alcohol dehydrogenase family)